MTDPWPEYLAKFAGTLERPSRTWSEAEAGEVWRSLAKGPVGQALYGTIRKSVLNECVAEELLQNLLAQLSMRRTYDPEGLGSDAFRRWMVACLHHHLCRYFSGEKKKREQLGEATDISDDAIGGLLTDEGRSARMVETKIDAGAMLGSLAPSQRDILDRNLKGETAEEIARELSLTPGNVRQILFRTNRDLRQKFLRKRQ
jgi:RNA polymerase sigma factor (sigma-70 family)